MSLANVKSVRDASGIFVVTLRKIYVYEEDGKLCIEGPDEVNDTTKVKLFNLLNTKQNRKRKHAKTILQLLKDDFAKNEETAYVDQEAKDIDRFVDTHTK